MRSIFINPVLNKEFKLRFRSFRTLIGLSAYLIGIGIVVLGFIFLSRITGGGSNYIRPEESRYLFMMLAYIQLGLVIFITPGLTAGVISGEREKQTLNILLTTVQSSTSIIMSKLFSSISYLLLMLIASLPFYSIVFLFGGVSPQAVINVFLFYIFTIFAIGSLGVFFSTLIRKTIVSMIATYGFCLFLSMGTAFLFAVFNAFGYSSSSSVKFNYLFAILNPVMAFSGQMIPDFNEFVQNETGVSFPVHWGYVILYSLISVLVLWISIKKLRPKMKPKKG